MRVLSVSLILFLCFGGIISVRRTPGQARLISRFKSEFDKTSLVTGSDVVVNGCLSDLKIPKEELFNKLDDDSLSYSDVGCALKCYLKYTGLLTDSDQVNPGALGQVLKKHGVASIVVDETIDECAYSIGDGSKCSSSLDLFKCVYKYVLRFSFAYELG